MDHKFCLWDIKGSFIIYLKLVKDIKLKHFQMNHYDPSIANNIVEGDQMDLVYNVDNINISHMNSEVVDEIIERMNIT